MGGSTFLITEDKEEESQGTGFVLPKLMNIETLNNFLFNQEGPLYCFPDIEVIGFVHTK